jgi:hypothetical protein
LRESAEPNDDVADRLVPDQNISTEAPAIGLPPRSTTRPRAVWDGGSFKSSRIGSSPTLK